MKTKLKYERKIYIFMSRKFFLMNTHNKSHKYHKGCGNPNKCHKCTGTSDVSNVG